MKLTHTIVTLSREQMNFLNELVDKHIADLNEARRFGNGDGAYTEDIDLFSSIKDALNKSIADISYDVDKYALADMINTEKEGTIAYQFADYDEDVTILSQGEEFDDFRSCMGEEYHDMTFLLVHHKTGYNQENFDIQIGVWDYDFENGIDKKDIIKLTWHAGNEEFFFANLKSIYACFSTDDVGITWASLNNYGIKEGKPYANKRCRIEKVQLLKAKKKKE